MEIEITKERINTLNKILTELTYLISTIIDDFKDRKIANNKRVFFDITVRVVSNLEAVSVLLEKYFEKNGRMNLPIGLIIRCCLEDILLGNYLLIFKEDLSMLETEIEVNNLNFFKIYLNYIVEKEPEHYQIDNASMEKFKHETNQTLKDLKNKYPKFGIFQMTIKVVDKYTKYFVKGDTTPVKINFFKENLQ